MNSATISHVVGQAQHGTMDVFCPMCDSWHANEGWCQADLNEMYNPGQAMEGVQ